MHGGICKSTKTSYLCFVTCKKQLCCKDKMLPGYTSLLKKLSNFPNTLTIFTAILTNGGIRKGIGHTVKGIKKNDIYDM